MKKIIILCLITTLSTAAFAQNMSLIPYRTGDKWGFANADRSMVIAAKYDEVNWFTEGLAAVKMGAKWGYINMEGKMIIPARYTVAKPFAKGYLPKAGVAGGDTVIFAGASLRADGYEICINSKGATLGQCPAKSEAAENEEPIGIVTAAKKYSLPNADGLFDSISDDFTVAGEQYYIAQKAGKSGVFNTKFDMLVPYEYQSITKHKAGGQTYLVVEKNGMFGILNDAGEIVLPADNVSASVINDKMNTAYFIVKKDGRAYVKKPDGTNLINRSYDDIAYDQMGGFVLTGDNNLKGFYFTDDTYISPKYTNVKLLPGGKYLQVTTYSGMKGIINNKGEEFFK